MGKEKPPSERRFVSPSYISSGKGGREEFIWKIENGELQAAFVRFSSDGTSYDFEPCNEWVCEKCHYEDMLDVAFKRERRECPSCGRKTLVPRRIALDIFSHEGIGAFPPVWVDEAFRFRYEDVRDFVRLHTRLPDKRYYDVLACFAIASWRCEEFEGVPYVAFLGPVETGKTHCLKILRELCYRAVATTSISPAAVSRVLSELHCTLLTDQVEKMLSLQSEAGRTLYSILLSGYQRGMPYIVAKERSDRGVVVRNVFGFKAIASEQIFDKALFSRCIIIRTRRGEPPREEIDEEWGFRLRSTLLMWRGTRRRSPDEPQEELPTSEDLREMGVRLRGREFEIWRPILAIYAYSGYSPAELASLIEESREEHREALSTSTEAQIIQALLDAYAHEEEISVSELAGMLDLSTRSLGRKLATLGIKREKSGGRMYVNLRRNEERLRELAKEYYLTEDEEEEEHRYLTVRLTRNLQCEIQGVDGQVYRLEREGQRLRLPEENARILIERGDAEEEPEEEG